MDSQNTDPNLKTVPNKINDTTSAEYGPQTAVGFDSVYKDIDKTSFENALNTKKDVLEIKTIGNDIFKGRKINKDTMKLCNVILKNITKEITIVFNETVKKMAEGTYNITAHDTSSPSVTELQQAAEPYYKILQIILKNNYSPNDNKEITKSMGYYENIILVKTTEYKQHLFYPRPLGGRKTLRKRKGKRIKTVKKRGRRTLRKGKRNGKRRRNTKKLL